MDKFFKGRHYSFTQFSNGTEIRTFTDENGVKSSEMTGSISLCFLLAVPSRLRGTINVEILEAITKMKNKIELEKEENDL